MSISALAYTSNGSDGAFDPTTSVTFSSGQTAFNFTTILIPSDVTVTFTAFQPSQPIELLAIGNIVIDGTVNTNGNSLWIETSSGSIMLYGDIYVGGGSLNIDTNDPSSSGISPPTSGAAASLTLQSPVPEPSFIALMLAGLGLLGYIARRKTMATRHFLSSLEDGSAVVS